jgi:hypothetical protein
MILPEINTEVSKDKVFELCKYYKLNNLLIILEKDYPLKPFKTDGASCFPDQIGKINIYEAAVLHDLKYWCGYKGDDNGRFMADLELARDVVLLCNGSVRLAELMFTGVRLGGGISFAPWRWGYGRD